MTAAPGRVHGACPTPQFVYRATIIEWHDGDTVKLDVDKGFEDFTKAWFRLYGIDTPELATVSGIMASDFVKKTWPPGTAVVVVSLKGEEIPVGKEKYGRWLAVLYTPGATGSINDLLVSSGFAAPYYGGKKGVAV